MRLNLGCGDHYAGGWVNVDWLAPYQMDEKVDLTGTLPAHWRGVTHVYLGHLLEHLQPDQCLQLLQRLIGCADPNGMIALAVGPDIDVALDLAARGQFDLTHHTVEQLHTGACRWPGDEHQWDSTAPTVVDLFVSAGWDVVTDLGGMSGLATMADAGSWPVVDRRQAWQYAIRAWT